MDWIKWLCPWVAIRRLERDNAALAGRLAEAEDARLRAVESVSRLVERNGRLNSLISIGHFRNPETGRLLRRGMVPLALTQRYLT